MVGECDGIEVTGDGLRGLLFGLPIVGFDVGVLVGLFVGDLVGYFDGEVVGLCVGDNVG